MTNKKNQNIELTLDLLLQDTECDFNAVSFEKGIVVLNELVSKVESGALSLEDSVRAYERGTALSNFLQSLLQGAEGRLMQLKAGKDGEIGVVGEK